MKNLYKFFEFIFKAIIRALEKETASPAGIFNLVFGLIWASLFVVVFTVTLMEKILQGFHFSWFSLNPDPSRLYFAFISLILFLGYCIWCIKLLFEHEKFK